MTIMSFPLLFGTVLGYSDSLCQHLLKQLRHRIEENLKVFDLELTAKEMDGLSSMEGNLNQYWQPLGAPVDVTCQQCAKAWEQAASSREPHICD